MLEAELMWPWWVALRAAWSWGLAQEAAVAVQDFLPLLEGEREGVQKFEMQEILRS